MGKKISKSEIKFMGLTIDKTGRVFFHDGRVFRAINSQSLEKTNKLFESGLMQELMDKGLIVETRKTDLELDGFDLILEQKKIEHFNYPYEWSFGMLKKAALAVLEANSIAKRYGFEIDDPHAYNVTFDGSRPKYFDIGSFNVVKNQKKWSGIFIFFRHFFIPLKFWSKGYSNIARNIYLMRDYFDAEEYFRLNFFLLRLIGYRTSHKLISGLLGARKMVSAREKKDMVSNLMRETKRTVICIVDIFTRMIFSSRRFERKIQKMEKQKKTSLWSSYHDTVISGENKRFLKICGIISKMDDARSMLDLGANQGKFSEYVLDKTQISSVVAVDFDEEAVDAMFERYRNRNNLLPLLVDVIRPSGRVDDESVESRVKCDIAVALALTHHLILVQNYDIEYVFDKLKKLSNKYVIIEFMPLGLYAGDRRSVPPLPEFYNLNWFRSNFVKYFDLIAEEELEINRHMFFGRIKNDLK